MLWKKSFFGFAVGAALVSHPTYVTYAQGQIAIPENQQLEDQKLENQRPDNRQPKNSQSTTSSVPNKSPAPTNITDASLAVGSASAAASSIGALAIVGVLSQIAQTTVLESEPYREANDETDDETSSSTYSSTILGSYADEYAANDALAFQNILSLNDYGFTGDGIRVSVVDSGIDASHQEFNGKTIYGVDFASSPSSFDEDENGHGTHVASIIAGVRDGQGMRGMAYDASLYSYKMDDDGDSGLEYASSDANIANVFNQHVTDNIHVSNNSWGVATEINTVTEGWLRAALGNTISAMRAAQNNGTIIIFASGNDTQSQVGYFGGLPYHISELADEWLVVASVDSAGNEAYYSNRCGVAYLFCVTAVGGDLTTPAGGVYGAETGTNNGTVNNYVDLQGTSMATPHVSGLAAALIEKFPSLTAAQIVARIKAGASYEGLVGRNGETASNSTTATMQSIFGHGLINSTASSSVLGTLTYAVGANLTQSIDLSTQSIELPSALPASVQNQIMQSEFAVFDSFDGARFWVTGNKIFETNFQNVVPAMTRNVIYDTRTGGKYNFTNVSPSAPKSVFTPKFMVTGLSNELTAVDAFWGSTAIQFQSSNVILPENRASFIWEADLGKMAIHPFIETKAGEDVDQSLSGYGVGFSYSPLGSLSLLGGLKSSQHTLLNGLFEEANSNGVIRDLELGIKSQISHRTGIFARYVHSKIEDIDATNLSFGLDGARTSGWNLGYELKYNDNQFVFGASKPNEVSDGHVRFIHPVGRTRSGQILYKETKFNISHDRNYEKYFLFNRDFHGKRLSFGLIEDRYNHGKIGAAKLEISFTF